MRRVSTLLTPRLLTSFALLCFAQIILGQTCLEFDVNDIPVAACPGDCVTPDLSFTEIKATDTYTVSSIDFLPPAPFSEGDPIIVGYDDIWSEPLDLPFPFCFFGESYSQITVGANGVVSFNMDLASPVGYDIFTASFCDWQFDQTLPNTFEVPYHNSINGAYHDIDPFLGGNVRMAVVGEAPCRKVVVNYEAVPHYAPWFAPWCADLITNQQIVLHESTNIIEIYLGDKPTCFDWNLGNAVVGIQNANGTLAYTPPGRNTGNWSATNEAWMFLPDGAPLHSVEWTDALGNVISTGAAGEICPEEDTNATATLTYDI